MTTPVPWHSLDPTTCETFVAIMLLRQHPNGTRRRPSQGDKGIDVIVPISDAPRKYDVYQIKYFYSGLTSSQRRQIAKSAGRLRQALRDDNLVVRHWHLVLPLDPTEGDEQRLESLFEGTGIRAYWKGLSHLEGWAADHRSVVDYYIFNGKERVETMVDRALRLADLRRSDGEAGLSIESTYSALTDIFGQLNADDPHYSYALNVSEGGVTTEGIPPGIVMSQFVQAQGGPTLRIDVFPRYREAPLDRPIPGQITISVPRSETDLIEQVRRFETYGEALSLPAGYATISIDSPLTGPTRSESAALQFQPLPPPPQRVRLIVAEPDGTRLTSIHMTVEMMTEGIDRAGYTADLRSDAGALMMKQRVRMIEDDSPDSSQFTLSVDWKNQIAAKIVGDLAFAAEVRSARKLFMAPEFVERLIEVVTLEEEQLLLAPWIKDYADALVVLQEFADEPLRMVPPPPEQFIKDTLALAELAKGAELGKALSRWAVEVQDPQALVDEVNATNLFSQVGPLSGLIGGATVTFPQIRYSAQNVTAELAAVDGQPQVLLADADGGDIQMSIRRVAAVREHLA